MQETIYKTINKVNVAVVPNAMLKTNGMIEFNKLMKHLNGNPPKMATQLQLRYIKIQPFLI